MGEWTPPAYRIVPWGWGRILQQTLQREEVLIPTDNLAGLLVIKLSVPVQKSEEWEGNQENEADPKEHVHCETSKVQALEEQRSNT